MVHGNKGKRPIDEEREKAYQKVHEILSDLKENHSTPFSMRIVKDSAGRSTLRDVNDFVYLPPSFSKRQCYLSFCSESGWEPEWIDKGKSKMKPLSEWRPREGYVLTEEQASSQVEGEVVEPIVSWRSFQRYWAKHFQELKVRAKGEDTCADCYLLALKLGRIAKKKASFWRLSMTMKSTASHRRTWRK